MSTFSNADALDNFWADPDTAHDVAHMTAVGALEWARDAAFTLSLTTGETWEVAPDFDPARAVLDADATRRAALHTMG